MEKIGPSGLFALPRQAGSDISWGSPSYQERCRKYPLLDSLNRPNGRPYLAPTSEFPSHEGKKVSLSITQVDF